MAVITAASAAPAAAVEVAPGVEWHSLVRGSAPSRVNVLELDPTRVRGVLSNGRVAGRERVSTMARRTGAVVAVNGGYFAASGDPVGVLAHDGVLLSEPVDGRSALAIGTEGARIGAVRFSGEVLVNGRERLLDGVDRVRGLIPACGGRGGDEPTRRPNAALTCTDDSELVLLTGRYGARPPRERGVEAVLRDGLVARVRAPGSGPVPRGAALLTGTGDAAGFLRDVALPRSEVEIALRVTLAGRELPVLPALLVGGGPRLLRAGRVAIPARREGFAPPQAPSFFGSFVAGRNPRTLAGVRADGALLLVTVDGRRPGWSAGMTLRESALLMRSLGARDALNLDGGGSTTMVVRGAVVNRPSDRAGERPVSDALLVMP